MKKVILSILFLTINVVGWANDDFSTPSIDQNFSKLDKIESFVESHPGTTLQTLKTENSDLVTNLAFEESAINAPNMAGDMPIVGSFWWGCCLGFVGLILVYFITDNDREQVKSALWGCLIATILWGAGGIWNPFGWF